MKKCSSCSKELSLCQFTKKSSSKDGLNASCRSCTRKRTKEHYKENKEYYLEKSKRNTNRQRKILYDFLIEYAKHGCEICSEKDFACIQFDHVDPDKKEFSIANALSLGYSISTVQEELKKCSVLCANCHAKKTAKQFGWYKNLITHP
jgi:hypothetical protein